MAFAIDATMKGYKVLGVKTGTSKAGKLYCSVSVFKDGRTAEVSSSDPEIIRSCQSLNEMDVVNMDVHAVAGRERSFVILAEPPVVVQASGVDY